MLMGLGLLAECSAVPAPWVTAPHNQPLVGTVVIPRTDEAHELTWLAQGTAAQDQSQYLKGILIPVPSNASMPSIITPHPTPTPGDHRLVESSQ